MVNSVSQIQPITVQAGVQPATDSTPYSTQFYTFSDKVRFRNGQPEKIGGWNHINFDAMAQINGVPRSIWSGTINQQLYTLIGTNTRLYALIGTAIYNITPFVLAPVTLGNVLSTDYGTLANNPIQITANSAVVRVNDPNASRYRVSDIITLSGATATGNQTAASINAMHVVRSIGAGYWTYMSAVVATTTVTGGGASVTRADGLVRVTFGNALTEGDRVKIANAAAFGGLTATQLNGEFIARNVTAAYFDYPTTGLATSQATGGGTTTAYYVPIASGYVNQSFGQGYGAGRYGVGLYGTALVSSTGKRYPRIWFFDRYGDLMLMTPGNGGGLYQWSGNVTTAPVLVTNAPTQINYFFVDQNIIVTFGNGGRENRITTSDQNGIYTWAQQATAQNQVYDDNIEGADRLLCRINVQGVNLLFTPSKVYVFQYVGLPNVWKVQQLTNSDGILSPQSAVTVDGVGYWQGNDNYYQWSGGNIELMRSQGQNRSTILDYTFTNLNFAQSFKAFAWHDPQFEEIRFHYPSAGSNEPDRVGCYNTNDVTWWPDTIVRTAAEGPQVGAFYPKLANVSGTIYSHNNGTDADGQPLTWTLTTNLVSFGKNQSLISAFIPDNQMSGSITVSLSVQDWPSGPTIITNQAYTISAASQIRVPVAQKGRFRQYTISGSSLGQYWRMGQWAEEAQQTGNGG